MNKKICLLTDSLSSGGAERMVSNLSISFHQIGYQVSIVAMIDKIDYPYAGQLYNFGKIKNSNSLITSFLKFRAFFKEQYFDIVIDHRVRGRFFKELIFSKYVFVNLEVIYCVHHYNLALYFPCISIPWLSKYTLVKKRKIVVVSKEIQMELLQTLKLSSDVIYNYALSGKVKNINDTSISLGAEYIVAVGRLAKIKQFDVLINSYKNSILPQHDIKLLILGEGDEKNNLNQLIKDLNLEEFIHLKGFKNNAFIYIKEAKALVMSSKSEGFPMVLIEALALETPIVSFDCKSGPSEIIKQNLNGILVENQNSIKLTEALNKLILDNVFYTEIKENLSMENNLFSEENILEKWLQLL
jgi:glycosyltransferase involved in cell wall biosynthesis